MKRFLGLLATGALALGISSAADAQVVRGIGAGALILDDNLGHKVTITAPQFGSAEWTAWSNGGFQSLTWSVPVPPSAGAQSGFVLTGPLTPNAGPYPTTRQLTYWIYPNQADNTNGSIVNGGSAGTWNSASTTQLGLLTAPIALGLNVIPKSDGAGNLIPSGFTDNATTITTTEALSSGAHTITAGGENVTGGIVAATGNISTSAGNITSSGTVTGATGVTATAGGVTATAGDINAVAGNLSTAGVVRIANNGNATVANLTSTGTNTFSGLTAGVGHLSAGGVLSSSQIVDADVAAAAAIAGTKISPNFGAQNVLTTGTLGAGASTLGATTATSINNTPIGLTTQSDGSFTTLTAGGAVNLNQSTSAPTNIGGGTGVVAIGNATGGTTITSPLTLGGVLTSAVPTSYLGVNGAGLVIKSSASVVTGSGTLNTLPKWNPAGSTLIDSKLNDNGTTLSYNAGVFTVTAATGNTSVGGTLNVTGATTLTSLAPTAGVVHNSATGLLSSSAVNLASNGAGGDVTGITAVANGGTNASSFTGSQLVVANGAGTQLVSGGTGAVTTVLHGGAAGAPTFSQVNLASGGDVTGILPVPNGGTGVNTIAANGVVIGAGASPVTTVTGAVNQVLVAQAGGVPAFGAVPLNQAAAVSGVLPIANGGTNSGAALTGSAVAISNGTALVQGPAGTTTTLLHGNVAGAPTYGQVVNADIANTTIDLTTKVTGVLPVANGGTNSNSFTGNTITVANAGGTALVSGPAGTTTTVLHGNAGGAPTYSAVNLAASPAGDVTGVLTVPNGGTGASTLATNGIVFGNGVGAVGVTAQGASNTFLRGNGAAAPTFGAVGLNTADVTGVLPIANGGTNSNAALTASAVAISNGTALVQGPVGSTTTVLHGNAAGAPTYGAVGLTTDVSGVLPVANGGTNSNSFTGNTITVSNAGGTALVSGPAGLTTTLLHGNAAGAPTYGAVGLTTDVTGVLPIANGGTNSSAALTGSAIAVSNGTQLVQGPAGTTTTVLHGNAAGLPTYAALNLTTDVTGILPVPNGGTGVSSITLNSIPVGAGAAATTNTGASTAAGQFLQTTAAGGAPTWATTLGVANGGTNSTTTLTNGKMMISKANQIVEAANINSDGSFLTAINGNITSGGASGSNLIAGDATHAGFLQLKDGVGHTATVNTATETVNTAQQFTLPDNIYTATSTIAVLENTQQFTRKQSITNSSTTQNDFALNVTNAVAPTGTNTSTGIIATVANAVSAGIARAIVANAQGGTLDDVGLEVTGGRILIDGTIPTAKAALDIVSSTSTGASAVNIGVANTNGIVSSVLSQGISSTTSSTSNGDFAVKGIVSSSGANQVDAIMGTDAYNAANGTTSDGNVVGVAMTNAGAPVLAVGSASAGFGAGNYSNGIVIKNGSFGVAGVQPAGKITGVDFSTGTGAATFNVNNPLCTTNSYILITPASAQAAGEQLYISSTAVSGQFVVTAGNRPAVNAGSDFYYFIITPVNR